MNNEVNDEIDFIEIFKKIYSAKKIIIIITFIFSLTGIAFSLLSPIKYSSSTVFIPQNHDNRSSSLSGVASLVGINLGSSSFGGEIPSSMYPEIGESPKFKRLILEKVVDSKNNLTLKEYLIKSYNLSDEENTNSSSIYISELEEKCFKILSQMISISVDQNDGFVTISTFIQNAEYSAVIANFSKEILQQIIIENRIESANQNLKFSQEQLNKKKIEFDEIQAKLSYFKDSNLNLVNSLIINEQDKLQAEFEIINAVVTELSKQVEQAKLQVTKDTPVFSTIKEAVIPNVRKSPKRTQTVLIFSLVGLIFSIVFVLAIEPLRNLLKEIKKN